MKFLPLAIGAALIAMTSAALGEQIKLTGTVTDVFGQRYVVDEGDKKSLVDIGPKGRDLVTIKSGDKIVVEGDLTDAGEVHALRVVVADNPAVELPASGSWWQKLTGAEKTERTELTAQAAKEMVTKGGYEVVGEPRPEKKHFEVLGKKDGQYYEVHAHRDGSLKGIHSVDAKDPKWGSLIR
jgi:hypothetical protein